MAGSVRSSGLTRCISVLAVLIAASTLVLAWPGAALGAGTYCVSVIGNDTVGSGSAANPFATVQKAVNVAGANGGGVVSVGAGMFSGDVTMTASQARVSIEGVSPSLTTLRGDGHGPVITVSDVGVGVAISGLSITGGGGSYGGGIACDDSSPTITGDTIFGNSTTNAGGGIYSADGSSPKIIGNTIVGNGSRNEGGGIYCENGSPTITGNAICGNSSSAGGGIGSDWVSYPTIANDVITGNSGGGIFCSQTEPTITGDTIMGNGGDGVHFDWGASTTISNAIIADNGNGSGAGVSVNANCSVTMVNDVVVGNRSGGINRVSSGATTKVTNCVVWGNGTDDLYQCVATYSDVSGGGGGVGDISVDPSFVDAPHGDYHLAAGSPCRDEATSTGAPATDRDGTARPWGAGVDMGAYEYFVASYHTTTSVTGSSSSKVNKTLTLSGVVSPTAASPYSPPGTVKIVKTRKVGKSWKSAGSATVGVVGAKFTYSFKPTATGSWHFTATYSGGVIGPTTYLPSASGVKGVTVKKS